MILLHKDGHYKKILKLALPAIAGLSAQMVVSLVDAAMIGRLQNAEYALAAMGISVLATWVIVSFFSSLATGTQVIIARRFGEGDSNACSKALANSLIIATSVGVFVAALGMAGAHGFAQFFAKDHRVGDLAGQFIFFRLIGLPFFLLTVSFRGFYFGTGHTRVFMVSGIIVNFLNIIFNYVLIYGKLGFPAMGVAGSGLGSSIATICDAFYYLIVSSYPRYAKQYHFIRNFRLNKTLCVSIVKLSLPVSFQNVFILIGFLSFVAITGLIGTVQQAASQAIISSLFLSVLPCMGFGIAVQTLVGNSVATGNIPLAKRYGFETAKIATLYTSALAILFIIFPQALLSIITENQTIIAYAVPAMRIAGIAQVLYGIGIVLANGLQSVGKTSFVMAAEVITNLFVLVPLSYFFGIVLHGGLAGAWLAMPAYILLYSTTITLKFYFDKWNTLRTI
jgi:putative MATE family efflux protein